MNLDSYGACRVGWEIISIARRDAYKNRRIFQAEEIKKFFITWLDEFTVLWNLKKKYLAYRQLCDVKKTFFLSELL